MAVIIKQVPWIFLLLPHSFVLLQSTSSSSIISYHIMSYHVISHHFISHHITNTSSIDLLNLLLSNYTHIYLPINLSIYLPTHKLHTIHYTILFHAITYYTILYYTILYYTILYYTIPYHSLLFYTVLYYSTYSNECWILILFLISFYFLFTFVKLQAP